MCFVSKTRLKVMIRRKWGQVVRETWDHSSHLSPQPIHRDGDDSSACLQDLGGRMIPSRINVKRVGGNGIVCGLDMLGFGSRIGMFSE
jgi:hypothetical protein